MLVHQLNMFAYSHLHNTSTASTPAAAFKKSTSSAGTRKLHTPPLSAVDSKLGIAHTTPSASCWQTPQNRQ